MVPQPPAIKRLDERTIQRIAAGEVVERPASVVKELVENSLDAEADRVSIAVKSGGADEITVRDDGVGIPADQLEAAVAEHATSKISDISDLDEGVGTLGFRGEALYTIGAVSRLTVRSRPADAEVGAEITVEGGDVGEVRPVGCPQGTSITVSDLFFNTPARRKFMKRTATEFAHVNTVVTSYALANPDVAVSLEHDERETFATEGNGDRRSAVLAVYGRAVAESMVDVSWSPADTDDDEPVHRVSGLVSHPETTRTTREYLSTYVNGRYVTTSLLREAVIDAYGGQLAPDRYPFAVLFVNVPPDDVDVNIHPRKLEVRFEEETAVKEAVEAAVTDALIDHGLIRSSAPRGRSAPEETSVKPLTQSQSSTNTPDGTDSGDRQDRDWQDETANNSEPDPNTDGTVSADEDHASTPAEPESVPPDASSAWSIDRSSSAGSSVSGREEPVDWDEKHRTVDSTDTNRPSPRTWQASTTDEARHQDGSNANSSPDRSTIPEGEGAGKREGEGVGKREGEGVGKREGEGIARREGEDEKREEDVLSTGQDSSDRSGSAGPSAEAASGDEITDPNTVNTLESHTAIGAFGQRTLAGGTTSRQRIYDSLPPLRVLGQLHETYVVAEASEGLVLIDQHAADERVNYERLRKEFEGGADAQGLATPVSVELTAREAALFSECIDELESIGFHAARVDERSVEVTAVPAVFDAALEPELIRDVISEFVSDAAAANDPVEDVVDELLADLACYPSVTGNTSLTEGSVVDLLDRLDACDNPYACPHGRPVIIRYERSDIEDRFERDYPGHAGRRPE